MSTIVFSFVAAIILFGGLAQGLAVTHTTRPSLDYLKHEVNRLYQVNSHLQKVFTTNKCDHYIRLCKQRNNGHAWELEGNRKSEQAKSRWSSSRDEYDYYNYYYNLYTQQHNDLVRSLDHRCRRCLHHHGSPLRTPTTTIATTSSEAPTIAQPPSAPEVTTTSLIASAIETTNTPLAPVETTNTPLAPVETTNTPLAPVETTNTPLAPVETTNTPLAPVETPTIPLAPVETTTIPLAPVPCRKRGGWCS